MPFQPGNTLGAKHGQWRAALDRAIKAVDGKRLRAAAEALLDQAALGEAWAVKELGDRLDGRPHQALDVAATGDITITLLSYGAVAGATDPPA